METRTPWRNALRDHRRCVKGKGHAATMEGHDHGAGQEERWHTEGRGYRGISHVAHAGKVLLKIMAGHLSDHCEREVILPEGQCGFRPRRSTVDTIFVVRRLLELVKRTHPVHVLHRLHQSYASVDRNLLSIVIVAPGREEPGIRFMNDARWYRAVTRMFVLPRR